MTQKSRTDRAADFMVHWRGFALTFTTTFGAIWVFVEAADAIPNFSLRNPTTLTVCFVISILLGLIVVAKLEYDCPAEGFESESRKASRIAKVMRPYWEFQLTRELLDSKIKPIDADFDHLERGLVFVQVYHMGLQDYVSWLQQRPTNLLNSLEVAKTLLVKEIPSAMGMPNDRASAQRILSAINALARHYAHTFEFEKQGRAISPPEGLSESHRLHLGWTKPIRDGIKQLIRIMDDINRLKPKDGDKLKFEIVFEEPPNIQAFSLSLEIAISDSLNWSK